MVLKLEVPRKLRERLPKQCAKPFLPFQACSIGFQRLLSVACGCCDQFVVVSGVVFKVIETEQMWFCAEPSCGVGHR